MLIHKLLFYINPVKLYSYLDNGKRKDKLVLLQDATDQTFSFIVFGSEIFSTEMQDFSNEQLKKQFNIFEKKLQFQKKQLNEYLDTFLQKEEVLNFPFLNGLVGFFSYDFGLNFENIKSSCENDQIYPSYYFLVPEEIIIFDHQKKEMWLVCTGNHSQELLDFFENLRNVNFKKDLVIIEEDYNIVSNLTQETYSNKFSLIKDYLMKGETYQVNFSQRFQFTTCKDPFSVYKAITKINPSKFQGYLVGMSNSPNSFEKFWLISNSPERLFRVSNCNKKRVITTRPIKGTIGVKGYESEQEVQLISKKLLDSKKDKAELEMIVDMARNDLGRICEFGTINVDEHREIEKYSHLLHTASNISGTLKDEVKLYHIFRALFPGASITGCPKKRTMQIIDKLEEFRRGVYCGSFGYFDCRGGSEFNIMIRTLFGSIDDKNNYNYIMHSGGGITINSDNTCEFKETFDKVNAFLDALKLD